LNLLVMEAGQFDLTQFRRRCYMVTPPGL